MLNGQKKIVPWEFHEDLWRPTLNQTFGHMQQFKPVRRPEVWRHQNSDQHTYNIHFKQQFSYYACQIKIDFQLLAVLKLDQLANCHSAPLRYVVPLPLTARYEEVKRNTDGNIPSILKCVDFTNCIFIKATQKNLSQGV